MFGFTSYLRRKVIVGGAITLASLAAASPGLPRAVAAASVPAAVTQQGTPPLTPGGVLNTGCLELLAYFAGPASPWGPFGTITWSGNPAAYAGSLSAFLFGSPAAPGLLQVCA
jgi:hypothetical protein